MSVSRMSAPRWMPITPENDPPRLAARHCLHANCQFHSWHLTFLPGSMRFENVKSPRDTGTHSVVDGDGETPAGAQHIGRNGLPLARRRRHAVSWPVWPGGGRPGKHLCGGWGHHSRSDAGGCRHDAGRTISHSWQRERDGEYGAICRITGAVIAARRSPCPGPGHRPVSCPPAGREASRCIVCPPAHSSPLAGVLPGC